MKRILLISLFLLCIAGMKAATEGFFVWADGDSICYKLDRNPKVTISEDGKLLVFLDGSSMPILSYSLEEGKHLKTFFGTYENTKDSTTPVRIVNGVSATNKDHAPVTKKTICGGRLIIIKDGVKYNTDGTRVDR